MLVHLIKWHRIKRKARFNNVLRQYCHEIYTHTQADGGGGGGGCARESHKSRPSN